MRRRRSRVPFIIVGGLALLLGATLAMAASGARPSAEILEWLGGQSDITPTASSSASDGDPNGTAAASDAAGESTPAAGSAGPTDAAVGAASPSTAPAGASGASPAPAATPGASASGANPSPTASASGGAGPSPQIAGYGQARAVYNGSRAKRVIALTFDDGYNPVALRQIVAILKREHVVATFFPYGWAVHKDPSGWQMVVAAGYPIGNHTQSHATLTSLTPDQVTSEMTRAHATIDLYSHGKSIELMRPPGGAFNAPTAKAIAKAGYATIVMWDVDTFDWQGPSAATILARATRGTNGSIVLMHSGPLNTPKALPAIIANYRARGFTFVTIPELLAAR